MSNNSVNNCTKFVFTLLMADPNVRGVRVLVVILVEGCPYAARVSVTISLCLTDVSSCQF